MTEITPSKCLMQRKAGSSYDNYPHVYRDGICKHCGLPDYSLPQGTLLTESLAEQVAPIILELDKLQESQLKSDIKARFTQYTRKFSSLNEQEYRGSSARRQEQRVRLIEQLIAAHYEYKPLQLPLEFYITTRYDERELIATGTGKPREQIYDAAPSLKPILGSELGREQSGCKHKVSAPTLQEGSGKALAEHLASCIEVTVTFVDEASIKRTLERKAATEIIALAPNEIKEEKL